METAVEFMCLFDPYSRTFLGQRHGEHDRLTLDSLSSQPSCYFSKQGEQYSNDTARWAKNIFFVKA